MYQILAYGWQTTPIGGIVRVTWPIFNFDALNHISRTVEASHKTLSAGRIYQMLAWSTGRGFKSYSGQSCVTTLGKLFTPVPLLPSSITCYRPRGWWCSAAGKVTAGLAESNGSLPPGGWLIVTCGRTAYTSGSALGPMLNNEYGKPLPLAFGWQTTP